jgi:hypothetical protein
MIVGEESDMRNRLIMLVVFTCILTGVALVATQPSPEDERRAAITLLRAVNTAEHHVKQSTGKFVPLTELIDHRAMGGVKAKFAVTGNTITYGGADVRLALSADATQYVATVTSPAPNYVAAFTDERGVIYTGKALE